MAERRRVARLNEQLKREVTELLRHKVKDPRIGLLTVTGVRATTDLAHARVLVSVLGEPAEKAATLEGLRAAAPFLRGELSRRLRLRRAPELHFQLDDTLEHATRIERLLEQVLPDDRGEGGGAADEGEDER